jgi:hypothetical protein
MSDTPRTPEEPPEPPQVEDFEPPAIIALGKLDEVTFGAAGPPFEGATSYF